VGTFEAISPGAAELYGMKILSGVNVSSVEGLLESCPLRLLAPGDLLLRQGEKHRHMFMILSGRLSVHLDSEASEPVAFLAAGETVGELSVLDERPASAFVKAVEPSRLVEVDEFRFWDLVSASHEFSMNLLMLMAHRLRSNNTAVSENMRLQREYRQSAMIDGLTALYNRRWLEEALPRYVTRFARDNRPLSVLLIDVDHFKHFNDTHGHPAGDAILVAVAHCLRHNVRPGDFVARYGGEEFVVILANADETIAMTVAERLREAVSREDVRAKDGTDLPRVTISVGAARLSQGQEAHGVVAAADAALYESKRAGRNRVTLA
jgi:diguanylate cyclase (GGDEF)-like protein